AIDPGLTERSQAPQEGPPDSHRLGSQRERFENVRAAAETAVDKYRNAVPRFGHHFRQRLDGRAKRFGRPPAMVRNHDPIDAVLEAQPRVLARVHSLDEEFPLPEFADTIGESPI